MRTQPLRAEADKLRRAPIWIAYAVLPLVAAAIGTFNYQQNLGVLTPGWENLWAQHTLFELCFFLPALVGAGCSWLMGLEHAGSNWNQVLASPVATWRVVVAKLVVGAGMLGVALAVTGALFVACGKAVGIAGLPSANYVVYLLLSWMGGVAVVAVQLLVSSLVRSFAAPVGVALGGAVMGLLLTAKGWGLWWPWALMQLASNSNGSGALSPAELASFVAASVLFSVAATAGCAWVVSRAAAVSE
ncbi:ABC transporter permease [uncultured Olsenella sp.]|uniref:ABC transporter permease n=1 Tax=uncultured Olsenella sp. TaxID=190764 RepID=UPI0026DDA6F3|nr:ABC transporter permease [uncultured Olsenella sp.]